MGMAWHKQLSLFHGCVSTVAKKRTKLDLNIARQIVLNNVRYYTRALPDSLQSCTQKFSVCHMDSRLLHSLSGGMCPHGARVTLATPLL